MESPKPFVSADAIPEQVTRGSSRRPLALACALLAIAVTGTVGYELSKSYLVPQAGIADEGFVQEVLALDLVMPTLERRDPVGSLSALYYSIDVPDPVAVPAADQQPGQSDASAVTTVSSDNHAEPQPATQDRPRDVQSGVEKTQTSKANQSASAPKTKEKVDTHGPVEGPEFTQRLPGRSSRGGNHDTDRDRSRDRDRDRDGNGVPPRLVMEERPTDVFPSASVYRVIARTSVLSEPSYSGRVIGQLEAGDRVLVEAKLGRWLKLRSRRGRGGFVMAEDVSQRDESARTQSGESLDRVSR
jgi:hypothetical protein